MAAPLSDEVYESLTRQHAVKVECRAGVEECSMAAEKVVGRGNLLAASRVSKAVVIFAKTLQVANELIQKGIIIKDQLIPVLPLSSPSKKIILSNVPPFLKNEVIARELSRFGKIVSPIRKLVLSPRMKHMISYRRVVYMVLKDGDELELSLKFKVDGFDYGVYVTSDTLMKCFGCGQTGHLVRACPSREDTHPAETSGAELEQRGSEAAGPAVAVPPAAAAGLEVEEPAAPLQPEGDQGSTSTEGGDAETEMAQEVSSMPEPAMEEPSVVQNGQETVSSGQTEEVSHCTDNVNTTVEVTDNVDIEMQEEETVFKVPGKRKKRGRGKGTKQAKRDVSAVEDGDSDSDGSLSESGWSVCSQDEKVSVHYSAEEIKKFLIATKGQKGVQVEEHFKDSQQFVHDVKFFRRDGAFTALEIFRLKKILTKLHKVHKV